MLCLSSLFSEKEELEKQLQEGHKIYDDLEQRYNDVIAENDSLKHKSLKNEQNLHNKYAEVSHQLKEANTRCEDLNSQLEEANSKDFIF